jgi:hypothetical protein
MAIPAFLKGVPYNIRDMTFTYAYFIVNAILKKFKDKFIKIFLALIPNYLI